MLRLPTTTQADLIAAAVREIRFGKPELALVISGLPDTEFRVSTMEFGSFVIYMVGFKVPTSKGDEIIITAFEKVADRFIAIGGFVDMKAFYQHMLEGAEVLVEAQVGV